MSMRKNLLLFASLNCLLSLMSLTSGCAKTDESQQAPEAPASTTEVPQAAPAPSAELQGSGAATTTNPVLVPQGAPVRSALASSDGEDPGTRVEIQELKRVSGGTVMLRFVMINESNQNLNFLSHFAQQGTRDYNNIGGTHLIDPVGKKKYLVVRDSEENCDCSKNLNALAPNSRINLWARFPAPPDDVEKIGVVVPHFIPMDDVPISR